MRTYKMFWDCKYSHTNVHNINKIYFCVWWKSICLKFTRLKCGEDIGRPNQTFVIWAVVSKGRDIIFILFIFTKSIPCPLLIANKSLFSLKLNSFIEIFLGYYRYLLCSLWDTAATKLLHSLLWSCQSGFFSFFCLDKNIFPLAFFPLYAFIHSSDQKLKDRNKLTFPENSVLFLKPFVDHLAIKQFTLFLKTKL